LVALIDEQLPEKVWDVVGAADFVRDHDEPDRHLFLIDRPAEGSSVRLLRLTDESLSLLAR
jgi:hypothetical protein